MTAPADITRARWLRLAARAVEAAGVPAREPDNLLASAGRMHDARTPDDPAIKALCHTLKWACQWFGHQTPAGRMRTQAVLDRLATAVIEALNPPDGPSGMAAMPRPEGPPPLLDAADAEPERRSRADIYG